MSLDQEQDDTILDYSKGHLSEIEEFVQGKGYKGNITLLAKDMSNRTYFRLKSGAKSYVIMDADPSENLEQFTHLSELLINHGFRVPRTLESDLDKGFLLLEDFGDNTFSRVLDADADMELKLYRTAINVLNAFNFNEKPEGLEEYHIGKLLGEVEIFVDWFWMYQKGVKIPNMVKIPFIEAWKKLFATMPKTPSTLVLRDFHVDNLMVLRKNLGISTCGILDFQDALWGSVMYDFVSLIEDARRTVSPDVAEKCWQWFLEKYPESMHDDLIKVGKILAAGRHIKVIGVFSRYAVRQNNSSKLVHLNRLWGYLNDHFNDPIFDEVNEWFSLYFPILGKKAA